MNDLVARLNGGTIQIVDTVAALPFRTELPSLNEIAVYSDLLMKEAAQEIVNLRQQVSGK